MRGWTMGLTIAIGLAGSTGRAIAQLDETVPPGVSGVRSSHRAIIALIAQATEQSPTFRNMVETIDSSDGIVYVEEGTCGQGVSACLNGITAAGERRILFVRVNIRKPERTLMATIGHELRHAIEVLSDPAVRNNSAMYIFFRRNGSSGAAGAFETAAAVKAGDLVSAELLQYQGRTRHK